jgi:predicted HicB family RNase H-like nuclease
VLSKLESETVQPILNRFSENHRKHHNKSGKNDFNTFLPQCKTMRFSSRKRAQDKMMRSVSKLSLENSGKAVKKGISFQPSVLSALEAWAEEKCS